MLEMLREEFEFIKFCMKEVEGKEKRELIWNSLSSRIPIGISSWTNYYLLEFEDWLGDLLWRKEK